VALPVFKTGEAEYLGLAGSIPVRLRRTVLQWRRWTIDAVPAAVPDARRRVPRTDALLADPRLVAAARRLGPGLVKAAVVAAQERSRAGELDPEQVADEVVRSLPAGATTLRPVLNATGVVLHTNLGRASLSPAALEAVAVAAGYVDVEFDLTDGRRAKRGRGTLAALRAVVPRAEVLVVNNGAAALVLATTALAAGRDILVSRGEMVEIGDGFRLPDLIASTGARIREVGTTNRTWARDYADAVTAATGAVLKVHPSNFRIEGFTAAASIGELSGLGVPLIVDIGSGLLRPDALLPDEPDVATALSAGASVVTCSGDKLLGGPQAGVLFGAPELIERLRRHPLARALRVDKLTLAALEATVAGPPPPTTRYLHADPDRLRQRCSRLAAAVGGEVVPSDGAVGGGGAPGLRLPGWAVALPPDLMAPLRSATPAVVGRVENGRLLLDLRCVPEDDDDVLARTVTATAAQLPATGG
jgi:L-seryl-tRNA(Ser) seleniumtransferase